MRYNRYRVASVATGGALAVFGLAACDATEVASGGEDRVIPTVSVNIENTFGATGFDSVSVRTPLRVRIDASDNSTLSNVLIRVFADADLR